MHASDRVLDGTKKPPEAAVSHENDDSKPARARRTYLSLSSFSIFIKNGPGRDSGGKVVSMMQSTQSRPSDDPASDMGSAGCLTTRRRSLPQRQMRPILVVIADVLIQEALEMTFIHDDYKETWGNLGTDGMFPMVSDTSNARGHVIPAKNETENRATTTSGLGTMRAAWGGSCRQIGAQRLSRSRTPIWMTPRA